MFRDDDPPQLQAIREAVVNMLIHADYFSKANPRISVFSDRIEFFNPGSLPKELRTIIKESFSMPRNPIVAKMYRYIKLAETIGSGFNKMINGWKSYYKIEPDIEGDIEFHKIVFWFERKDRKEKLKRYDRKKQTEELGVKLGVKLGVNEEKILNAIIRDRHVTIIDLSHIVKISTTSIENNIKKLKKKRILKRVGSDKNGYWDVGKK